LVERPLLAADFSYDSMTTPSDNQNAHTHVSFYDALKVWAKVGLMSFGGPAGQIALMHRMLVDEKRWISEERFLHALNYCMLLPGPEAQQLAVYIGWLLHRTLGGLVAGTLFIVPGAVVIMTLSALYARYSSLAWMQSLFFGIKAAVLVVVIEAVLRIGKRALRNNVLYSIAGLAFLAIFLLNVSFPIIIAGAALAGLIGSKIAPQMFAAATKSGTAQTNDTVVDRMLDKEHHTDTSKRRTVGLLVMGLILWFAPLLIVAALQGTQSVYFQQGVFFSKLAVVTFGGAYAVLSYVAQEAASHFGWVTPTQMMDGLGLAETTPGPLILVVQFVAFMGAYQNPGSLEPMLAGVLAALLTLWVTFVPCFLWIFLGAPYIEKLRKNTRLNAALTGITAAVVGVILNLAVWFAMHVSFGTVNEIGTAFGKISVPDWSTLKPDSVLLSVAAAIAMLRFKVGMIPVLLACGIIGVLWKSFM
jgi:chromate transporter